jgi:hypothetical protein
MSYFERYLFGGVCPSGLCQACERVELITGIWEHCWVCNNDGWFLVRREFKV